MLIQRREVSHRFDAKGDDTEYKNALRIRQNWGGKWAILAPRRVYWGGVHARGKQTK